MKLLKNYGLHKVFVAASGTVEIGGGDSVYVSDEVAEALVAEDSERFQIVDEGAAPVTTKHPIDPDLPQKVAD